MIKRFFISMLGTIAGIWISAIVFAIGVLFSIGIIIGKNFDASSATSDSILLLDLSGDVPERVESPDFSDILSLMNEQGDALDQILAAIKLAADDKQIKGIYIDCNGSSMGIASRQEVVEVLQEFKKTGKWIYAYGDDIEQGDYYIASVADKVFLNPVGDLKIHGLQAQTMFFKDVLDKLGVEVQIVKVGSFKSAVEPFIRMDMSEPSRLQTTVFLTQIWDTMAMSIADNMGVTKAAVNMWADSLSMAWPAEQYVAQKAISELRYRSEVESLLRKQMKLKDDDKLPFVTPGEYMAKRLDKLADKTKDHIAVLYAVGDIVQDGKSGIVGLKMVPEIQKLALDKKVKGLVLRVNSGGGSAFASEQIWAALEDFKKTGKPLYVSMGDYAASGGYYISCGADQIYCDPTTITGSIGIFGMFPNAHSLLTEKIGLGIEYVATNPDANMNLPYTAVTPKQLDAMQKYVERGYDLFTSRVAQGRNIPVDSVKAIGGGRVWDGMTALKIGLVDKFGSLNTTISAMAQKLNLKSEDYVSYPISEASMVQTLLRESKKNLEVNIDGVSAEEVRNYLEIARNVKNLDPMQARMDNITIK